MRLGIATRHGVFDFCQMAGGRPIPLTSALQWNSGALFGFISSHTPTHGIRVSQNQKSAAPNPRTVLLNPDGRLCGQDSVGSNQERKCDRKSGSR